MEERDTKLTIRIETKLRDEFNAMCESRGLTGSKLIRQMMRDEVDMFNEHLAEKAKRQQHQQKGRK